MKIKVNSGILFLVLFILAARFSIAETATSRSSWLINEIYNYNHRYASQSSGELETKMNKMYESAFAFYRGTAHIFYRDMTTLPASHFVNVDTSKTWLSGDMHPQNLGAFRDSSGNHVFSINDWDEGYLGPYVWDVRRMAVGIMLSARANGINAGDRETIVREFLERYLDKVTDFKGNNGETNYRLTKANTTGEVDNLLDASIAQNRNDLLNKHTFLNGTGTRQFMTNSTMVVVDPSTYQNIEASLISYKNSISSDKRQIDSYYTLKDIRHKLGSGIGSLGRQRYWLLIEGPSGYQDDDRILVMKEMATSSVALAVPGNFPESRYGNHEANRAVKTQKAMETNTEELLGYTTIIDIPFLIREKSPHEVDFDLTQLDTTAKYTEAVKYMAYILAKSHSLADKDYDSAIVPQSMDKEISDISNGKHAEFKDEIVAFAVNYLQQVDFDWASFKAARDNGLALY